MKRKSSNSDVADPVPSPDVRQSHSSVFDPGQRIADVVRKHRGELTQRREAFGSQQLLLELFLLSQITELHHDRFDAAGLLDRHAIDVHRQLTTYHRHAHHACRHVLATLTYTIQLGLQTNLLGLSHEFENRTVNEGRAGRPTSAHHAYSWLGSHRGDRPGFWYRPSDPTTVDSVLRKSPGRH